MSNILIGLPIYKREWILPYWIEAIERQDFPQENLGFLFNLGPDDEATHEILWEWQSRSPHFKIFDAQIMMTFTIELTKNKHELGMVLDTKQWFYSGMIS